MSFAFLVTALLFARSGLYAGRAERPGLTRIVSSLTAVAVVALLYAVVNGQEFSSYYIFYGSLFFGVAFVASFRCLYERITGAVLHAAGYHRSAVLVGTGHHIEAVANALSTGDTPVIKVAGFVSLEPRPDNGVPSLGVASTRSMWSTSTAWTRSSSPTRRSPSSRRSSWRTFATGAARAGRAVDDGDPRAPRRVHPRRVGPALRAQAAGKFEGFDFALKRSFDLVILGPLVLALSPVLLACALAVRLSSRGPVIYRSLRPGIGACRSGASRSARCTATRTSARPTSSRSTRPAGRSSRSGTTRG